MLVGIEGGLGSGKTLIMTKWGVQDSLKGRKVLSNYRLFDIDFDWLNMAELLSKNVDLKNATILIDEITVFADCRRSMSNTIFSYFILQTRKRNVCLYYTTQDFAMIDKRIFAHTNILVHCSKVGEYENLRRYDVIDRRDDYFAKPTSFIMDIRNYFKFYDTDEIIVPVGKKEEVVKNE